MKKKLYLCTLFMVLSSMEEVIRHEGVVMSVSGQMAHISIVQTSACQACKAHNMCMSAESKVKEMDALMLEPMQVGDRVEVQVKEHLAWRAVFLAYVLPFLVMMAVMLILLAVTALSDAVVGTASLSSIALYYLLLTVFSKRLSHQFSFTARKI